MPFPSRACYTCRTRHLKCDEAQPECGQCQRSSRDCIGYEGDESSLMFRDENVYVSSGTRRPRGGSRRRHPPPRLSRTALHVGPQSRQTASRAQKPIGGAIVRFDSQNMPYACVSIHSPMRRSLQDEAMADFARVHFVYEEGFECMFTLLHNVRIVSSPPPSSAVLDMALSAISLATFGQRRGVPSSIVAGCKIYSEALPKIRDEMSQGMALTDQLMLAVMLFSAFEHRIGNFDQKSLFSEGFRHQDGALALLKLRARGSTDTRDLRLDQFVRRQVIRSALFRAIPIPIWLHNGADFGEQEPELGLDRCLVKLVDLRSRAIILLRRSKSLPPDEKHACFAELHWLVQEASVLDRSLVAWATNLSSDWLFHEKPRLKSDCHHIESLHWGDKMHVYSSIMHASAWNRYRAARLITNGLINKALAHTYSIVQTSATDMVKAQIQQKIQSLVDDICHSVSFFFGTDKGSDITEAAAIDGMSANRAHALVWPLVISSATLELPDKQRQWIKSKLVVIGEIVGSGILKKIANTDLHLHASLCNSP